jgi:hypothetical protein
MTKWLIAIIIFLLYSVMGGALMVTCLDYFIELGSMVLYVWDRMKGVPSLPLCWYSWVILGCWPFCFLVGALVQWRVTSLGVDHRESEWMNVHGRRKDLCLFNAIVCQHAMYQSSTDQQSMCCVGIDW